MKKDWNNIVALTLIVSIGAGGLVFSLPKKVEAGVSECLAGILAGKTQGKAEIAKASFSGLGMTVPTNDASVKAMVKANANISTNASGQAQGMTVTRCIVEPLVTSMARSLLSNFTAQTVKWINSGFKGSPLYVTNLQGFMTGVADQAVGSFIEGLGPIGRILCSPFDLQLRLALSLQYSSGYVQEIGCRLSDIQQNVQKAFTGGKFGKDGWNNWLQLTSQPQNNVYGAFLRASDTIDGRIANKINDQTTKLNWGKGFLSATDANGNIVTPGTVIEDQLNKTLAQPLQNIGLAKDIDAILGALVGQMINQVMGGLGGLAGASKTPSSGGRSLVDRGINTTVDSIIASNKAAQNLPNGLYVETNISQGILARIGPTATDEFGKPTGPSPTAFCIAFKKNSYSAVKNAGNVLTNSSLIVVVKVNGTNSNIATKKEKDGIAGQWTLADYNAIVTFCKSVSGTSAIFNESANFNDTVTTINNTSINDTFQTDGDSLSTNGNIALNRPTEQSSIDNTHRYDAGAQNAVDGNTTASVNGTSISGLALTKGDTDTATGAWWQVDLGDVKPIGTVQIYRSLEGTYLNFPFYVFITKTKMPPSASIDNLLKDTSGNITYKPIDSGIDPTVAFGTLGGNVATIPVNVSGRFVRIAARTSHKEYYYYNNNYYGNRLTTQTSGICPIEGYQSSGQYHGSYCVTITVLDHQMGLAEVKVFPPGVAGSVNAPTVLNIAFTPPEESLNQALNLGSGSLSVGQIRLVSNQDKSGLKARIKLMDNTPGITPSQNSLLLTKAFRTLTITAVATDGKTDTFDILDTSLCLSFSACKISIKSPFATESATNSVLFYNTATPLKLSANQPLMLTFKANASFVTPTPGYFKLVTEIMDGLGNVLASHTTNFVIQ